MASILLRLERAGALAICRNGGEVRAAIDGEVLAAIFHIEGAEAIDTDFRSLDVLYAAGLRSIGHHLEPGQCLWHRGAVPAQCRSRYRAGAERCGQGTGAGVQPAWA